MSKPCKRSQISGGPWSQRETQTDLAWWSPGRSAPTFVAPRRLGGGDVAESYRLTLGDGHTVFAKTHRDPPPGFFTTEAIGLAWLRQPGVVAVPEVLAVSDGDADHPAFVVLEWIDEGRPTSNTETDLGASLAALHRAGAPCFGREDRRTTGSRALPNDPCDSWVEFYATRRLEPLARLATDQRALPSESLGLLGEVIARLDDLGGPEEPPARLHGDLWAGNRLVDHRGRSWLIDPAAHGGHREVRPGDDAAVRWLLRRLLRGV